MADFCKECSIVMFGEDFGDLAGLVEEGDVAVVLCEGCGTVAVDDEGVVIAKAGHDGSISIDGCGTIIIEDGE